MPENPLNRFLAELKSRRVPRVLLAYLVASFVLLQVADLMVEPLGLPGWTMTMLIVVLGLGLVLAAVLAWAFDVTPDGIRRVPTAGGGDAPERPGRPVALMLVLGAVVGLGLAGWLAFRSPLPTAPLDEGVVAVLPARVAGADASLGYVREGILDLLGAKLGGDFGPRAVDPRTMLHALGTASGAESTLPLEGARAVARRLGAGRLLLSEVVGRPDRLTVAASLLSTADGSELSRARVQGTESSLDSLTDALVVQLLAGEAGEAAYRIPSLTSSLPAMQAYLRGREAYRAGRHDQAAVEFHRALELDSTFALAAMGFVEADQWTYVLRGFRDTAYRLAWNARDELSGRDRDYLEVFLGPNYPEGYATAREELQTVRRALASAPDRPELHYRLGDVLLHRGMAMGEPDAIERADEALRRAVELDPRFVGPLQHLAFSAARRGDTAEVRRLAETYITSLPPEDRDGESATELRWLMHTALGDPPPSDPDSLGTRAGDASSLGALTWGATVAGQDPRLTLAALRRYDAGPAAPTGGAVTWLWLISDMMGLPSLKAEQADRVEATGRANLALLDAMFGLSSPEQGHAARDRLAALVDAEPGAGAGNMCLIALWDALAGAPDAAAGLARRLPRAGPRPDLEAFSSLCETVVPAVSASARGEPAADGLLRRAEEALAPGPRVNTAALIIYNLVMARALEERGEVERALASVRRAEMPYDQPYFLAEKLRTEGRLAALAGDRDGAIRAYQRYFALRPDPEPAARAADEPHRRTLARLIEEPSDDG